MFGVAWKSFWQLLSWSDSLPHLVGSLGGEVCFPPLLLFPSHSLWTALTRISILSPVLKHLVVATLITQSDRSAFPHFTLPNPGMMRTWRRRKNFGFLILALRVWCLSTAAKHADSMVYNIQRGEWISLLWISVLSLSGLIVMYSCRCSATVWKRDFQCLHILFISLFTKKAVSYSQAAHFTHKLGRKEIDFFFFF